MGDARRIGRRARRLIARAAAEDTVRVSVVSVFEVAALHTLGRIRLTRPPEQWIREALAAPGVRLAELSPAIAVDAGGIPRMALGDPLDRLLVATARQSDATLLSGDERILAFATPGGRVRVHDARL